jgi:hypothetical protein
MTALHLCKIRPDCRLSACNGTLFGNFRVFEKYFENFFPQQIYPIKSGRGARQVEIPATQRPRGLSQS